MQHESERRELMRPLAHEHAMASTPKHRHAPVMRLSSTSVQSRAVSRADSRPASAPLTRPAGLATPPQPEVFGSGLSTKRAFASSASVASLQRERLEALSPDLPPNPIERMLLLQRWRASRGNLTPPFSSTSPPGSVSPPPPNSMQQQQLGAFQLARSSSQALLERQQASLLSPREFAALQRSPSTLGEFLALHTSPSCCSIVPASIQSPRITRVSSNGVVRTDGRTLRTMGRSFSAAELREQAEAPAVRAATLRGTNGDGRGREWRMRLGLRDDIQGALRIGLTAMGATPLRGDGMIAIPDASQHDHRSSTWVNSHSHSTLVHSRSFA